MPSHYQIRWWYIVNWTLFSLYEDFSRKYRPKCRLQNDSNFGRAVEASCRFAVHDYLTRPRAYATISTAETCLKLIGDFTKYGQPVPRPDPTWGVGIAHFQLWGWRYPSCAQTVPFFLRMDIFSQYGEVINSISPRDSYMHHWPGSPLTQVMA